MQGEFERRGVAVVGISADPPGPSGQLRARLGLRVPLLSDPGVKVAGAYGVASADAEIAIPAVLVLRADGTIEWRHVGETQMDRPTWEEVLERADAASAGSPR